MQIKYVNMINIMNHLDISNIELYKLRLCLKKERKKNGCNKKALKINVIINLAKGWSITDISDALELDEETIRKYLKKYKKGKVQSLLQEQHYGTKSSLTPEEQNMLCQELRNNLYRNVATIQNFVKRKFNAKYSRSGMTKLLHQLGFSYKKPKKFVQKTSVEEQEKFIKEKIEPLLSNPNDENYFMDAAHPTIQTNNSYGWFERGKETVLSSQGSKQRLNLIGSVLPNGKKIVIDYPEEVNAKSIVHHLLKIVKSSKCTGNINVFWDNASSHVKASKDPKIKAIKNLNLIFLPSYSPNLNLVERLWLLIRRHVIDNHFFHSKQDLKDKINRKICRWRVFVSEIQNVLKPKFHLHKNVNMLFT